MLAWRWSPSDWGPIDPERPATGTARPAAHETSGARTASGRLGMGLVGLLIVALVVSLGSLARLWLSAWGLLLVVGVLILGILLPLVLYRRPRLFGGLGATAAPVLVLVGGFLLRVVIILSSEAA